MDLIEWFRSFSARDWLTFVLAIFAVVGFFNSILGLRTRYKDWKATKSKELFQQRIKELKKKHSDYRKYRESPAIFLIDIIHDASMLIGLTSLFSILYLLALLVYNLLEMSKILPIHVEVYFFYCIILAMVLFGFCAHMTTRIDRFYKPELLDNEINNLIDNAKKKGFVTDEEHLREFLVNDEILELNS